MSSGSIKLDSSVLDEREMEVAAHLVSATETSALLLGELFISWHGVAVLTFAGFTVPLLQLKQRLERTLQLVPENSGSRWPKVTLGCVRDGHELSLVEARSLRRACDVANAALATSRESVDVTALDLVVFDCRSLERVSRRHRIELRPSSTLGSAAPAIEQQQLVGAILGEFSGTRLPDYLERLQRAGGRESHYRLPWRESTLVLEVAVLPAVVDTFCRSVDQALPDVYRWFEASSRHVTIRALVRQTAVVSLGNAVQTRTD